MRLLYNECECGKIIRWDRASIQVIGRMNVRYAIGPAILLRSRIPRYEYSCESGRIYTAFFDALQYTYLNGRKYETGLRIINNPDNQMLNRMYTFMDCFRIARGKFKTIHIT